MSEVVKLTIVADGDGPQPDSSSAAPTVGERLAAARVQQELTVEQVANQLKWSARQITEIEAGNYAVFPDMLTVRGFIRTYAKILKIDSTQLVQDLATEYERLPAKPLDRPKLDTPFPSGKMPLLGRNHNSSQRTFGAALLLVLCVLAVFVWRDEFIRIARNVVPAGGVALDAPTPEVGRVTPTDVKEPAPAVDSTQQEADNRTDSVQKPTAPLAEPVHEKVEAAPVAKADTGADKGADAQTAPQVNPKVAADSANALILDFNQDSWVQIKRANGTVLISKLYKAGTQETVAVDEPMNMIVGNAPGVEAKLRGQNLALPLQPGSNVVNLSIK